ncbi:MAG: hypothetical protein DRN26_05475 [Thermoplasmata archaeon]|nr:MAG: hypothetical protein DRN26_05475 [Thermoplasmata archaeon]
MDLKKRRREMKISYRITCFLLFSGVLFACQCFASEYDFRRTRWGMTKEEVIKAEKAKSITKYKIEGPFERIYYKVLLLKKYKFNLQYEFLNGHLVAAHYSRMFFGSEYKKNLKLIRTMWSEIKDALWDLYGEPFKNKDDGEIGFDSIVVKDYVYETQNTEIHIYAGGVEPPPYSFGGITISYYGKKYKSIYDKKKMQAEREKKGGEL